MDVVDINMKEHGFLHVVLLRLPVSAPRRQRVDVEVEVLNTLVAPDPGGHRVEIVQVEGLSNEPSVWLNGDEMPRSTGVHRLKERNGARRIGNNMIKHSSSLVLPAVSLRTGSPHGGEAWVVGCRSAIFTSRPEIRLPSARPLPDYNHEVILDVVQRE